MTQERKKVLFLVPAFAAGVGGAERVIATILRYLDHSRFECHLALVGTGGAYLDRVPPSVSVHELGVSRMRYALPAIIRLVWRLRPRTLLTTVTHLNFMLVLARPFLPRDLRLLLREATTPGAFIQKDTQHPILWRWGYRHLYPRAKKIICLSDSMVEEMVLHFAIPREKLVRIYNPVDNTLLQLAAGQFNPYQGNVPHLVVAGRLRKEKGFDVLLDAMPAIIQSFPSVRLAVLGEGPQESELKAQAARLGVVEHVDFMGFRQNPWPYIKHADLFVLASRFEGLPNAMLEALALGTPVVATDCSGGIREIPRSAGRITLVPPDSPNALAEGIIAALGQRKRSAYLPPQVPGCLKDFEIEHVVSEYSRLF